MSNVFFDIEVALQTKLDSITGKPYIQWENEVNYRPSEGTRYWRPTTLPIRSEMVTAAALQKHTGLWQVDVITPINQGTAQMMTDLDLIYTAFNTTNSLQNNNTIVNILSVGRGRISREKSWMVGFIEIFYMCYAQ